MTNDAPATAPATVRGGSVLGSGLSVPAYGLVLLLSVALFIFFGGPLWSSRGSHGLRFLVSYGVVLPLSALALLASHAFTSARFATAVGTMWAIKLLLTAPLYYALAPGGALEDIGALPSARAPVAPVGGPTGSAQRYLPAVGDVAAGTVRGRVLRGGRGVAGVVVMADAPAPGRPLGPGRDVVLELTEHGFAAPLWLVSTADTVHIQNDGSQLHTARVRSGGHTRLNAPVPPGTKTTALTLDAPGELEVTCETHPGEHAVLMVADHPYAVQSGEDGVFVLEGVTAGAVRIVALEAANGKVKRVLARAEVRAGESVELLLTFDNTTDSEERKAK